MKTWPEFILEIKGDMSYRWLAGQLGVSKGYVQGWVNPRKGRERKPPLVKYWPDLISLAHAAGIKDVDFNYLGGVEMTEILASLFILAVFLIALAMMGIIVWGVWW